MLGLLNLRIRAPHCVQQLGRGIGGKDLFHSGKPHEQPGCSPLQRGPDHLLWQQFELKVVILSCGDDKVLSLQKIRSGYVEEDAKKPFGDFSTFGHGHFAIQDVAHPLNSLRFAHHGEVYRIRLGRMRAGWDVGFLEAFADGGFGEAVFGGDPGDAEAGGVVGCELVGGDGFAVRGAQLDAGAGEPGGDGASGEPVFSADFGRGGAGVVVGDEDGGGRAFVRPVPAYLRVGRPRVGHRDVAEAKRSHDFVSGRLQVAGDLLHRESGAVGGDDRVGGGGFGCVAAAAVAGGPQLDPVGFERQGDGRGRVVVSLREFAQGSAGLVFGRECFDVGLGHGWRSVA